MVFNVVVFTRAGVATARKARGALAACKTLGIPSNMLELLDVRAKDDLELYYKTIPDYFEQDDGRKLTEIPDRTSTDMIEGRY